MDPGRCINGFMMRRILSPCLLCGLLVASVCGGFVRAVAESPLRNASARDQLFLPVLELSGNSQSGITALNVNQPIRREISAGEEQLFQVDLKAGDCAQITIEEEGADVLVRVFGADPSVNLDFDDEIGSQGVKPVEFVAGVAGRYTILVKPRLRKFSSGFYTIDFSGVHPATATERAVQESRALRTQSERLVATGNYDDALPLAQHALTMAESVLGTDDVYVAQLKSELGYIYDARSDHDKPQVLYEDALRVLTEKIGSAHPQTAFVACRLGGVLAIEGDYPKADALISPALETEQKVLGPEHPWVAVCLRSQGLMYRDRGDAPRSEQSYLRALAIAEAEFGKESILAADLLTNLGAAYLDAKDDQIAEQVLTRSLAIKEKQLGPDHLSLAWTLQNLGVISGRRKDYAEAKRIYLRALSIREKSLGPEHRDIAANLINIANLYHATGDDEKCLETHLRAFKIVEKTSTPYQWITIISLGNIANTYAALGDIPRAIAYQARVEQAIEGDLAANLVIGSEREKLDYFDQISQRMDRTVSLNLRLAPNDATAAALAAQVLLQRKGRVLDAMTDSLGALQRRSSPEDQALLAQLKETTAQLAHLALSGPEGMPPQQYQSTIKDLEGKKEELEAQVSRSSSEFRAQSQSVSLEAVQAAIPEDAALLEFVIYRPFDPKAISSGSSYGEPHYAVYVVRKQGAPQGIDLGEAKPIQAVIAKFRQALRDPFSSNVREYSRDLNERIMGSIRPLITGARRLLVSPDGDLNLVPFEALLDQEGHYLVQGYSVSYLTTGRDLLRLQVAREGQKNPVIVADPDFGEPRNRQIARADPVAAKLQSSTSRRRGITIAGDLSSVYFAPLAGTALEARAIKSLFPQSTLLTGPSATVSALKRLQAPSVLHIATHGFFLVETPPKPSQSKSKRSTGQGAQPAQVGSQIENPLLRSGLALAGANLESNGGHKGILTALEASDLNLWGTKLVTLSACDTGVGEVRNGEGVYGLRRSFFLAGTETLVMSLWPVSDRVTREMMTAYYTGLKHGLGRGDALREAELAMMKRKGRQHPFYWASFIQAGAWGRL